MQPGLLSDTQIKRRVRYEQMIDPFVPCQIRYDGLTENGHVISYGLSSYGYDARVADEWLIFTDTHSGVVDPKRPDDRHYVKHGGEGYIDIPPRGFVLGRTVEYFRIPGDILVTCLGKSTYARNGINVIVTPLEPGWHGHVTLEFINANPKPARLYANEGACQFLFFQGSEPCETTYAARAGKYQGQVGVTPARM